MKGSKTVVNGNNLAVVFVTFVVYILMEGCASFTPVDLTVRQGLKPVSMTPNINKEYRLIKHVKVEQKVPFLFLVRLNPESGNPDLDEMLQPELTAAEGDAIVNVKIKGRPAFGDIFLPIGIGVVGAFVFPPFLVFTFVPFFEDLKTYTVEGDIVRYVEQKPLPESEQMYDPVTGLPIKKPAPKFDPDTGLPVKP